MKISEYSQYNTALDKCLNYNIRKYILFCYLCLNDRRIWLYLDLAAIVIFTKKDKWMC